MSGVRFARSGNLRRIKAPSKGYARAANAFDGGEEFNPRFCNAFGLIFVLVLTQCLHQKCGDAQQQDVTLRKSLIFKEFYW